MSKYPSITILAGREKRVREGTPWIYANEIQMDKAAKELAPGSLVRIKLERGGELGVGTFNSHSLIAVRRLDDDSSAVIDQSWFEKRFQRALSLRARFFDKPYYRLVHAEGDGLSGLIIDRYGDTAVVQANSAGMDALLPVLVPALQKATGIKNVVLNRAGAAVKHEGLSDETRVLAGEVSAGIRIEENDTVYFADPLSGQKTGWFYDQRANRAFVASLCKGKTVLDGYTYAGGFGLLAAKAGAVSVTLIDSAAGALQLAERAAAENKVNVKLVRADVMEELSKRASERIEVVVLDPPAFIKAKKDTAAGLKGYAKLARLGAAITASGGFLVMCSCSHHASVDDFTKAVAEGVSKAGRTGRIVRTSGAGVDHPVHPQLPETAYLKCLVLQLD